MLWGMLSRLCATPLSLFREVRGEPYMAAKVLISWCACDH